MKYVIFLRGINVGGHHKVPMADLKQELAKLGFENIITILNSGNIIVDSTHDAIERVEEIISNHLAIHFGFAIPTIARKADELLALFNQNPFEGIEVTKDIRLYISLLKKDVESDLELPWISTDKSFQILGKWNGNILSVLDVSEMKTPKAMGVLEKSFGKEITTRNWKTIVRIEKKLN